MGRAEGPRLRKKSVARVKARARVRAGRRRMGEGARARVRAGRRTMGEAARARRGSVCTGLRVVCITRWRVHPASGMYDVDNGSSFYVKTRIKVAVATVRVGKPGL